MTAMTKYKVVGLTVSGKRFRINTDSFFYAMNINLWRGAVWERTQAKQWRIIKRVLNDQGALRPWSEED